MGKIEEIRKTKALKISVVIFGAVLIVGFLIIEIKNEFKDLKTISKEDFDRYRKIYHDDYITTVKMLIQDCKETFNHSLVVVRHNVDWNGKHLGIIYRCEGYVTTSSSNSTREGKIIPSNKTLQVKYTEEWYELPTPGGNSQEVK